MNHRKSISYILLHPGERIAKDLLRQAQEMFSGILDITHDVILVNAKDDSCEGVKALKEILKNRRDEIAVSESISYNSLFDNCYNEIHTKSNFASIKNSTPSLPITEKRTAS